MINIGILDNKRIISGVKNIKARPTNRGFRFRKSEPVGAYNYPLTEYTTWTAFGYRIDKYSGIKRPHWIRETLPTGHSFKPGEQLDEVVDVKAYQHGRMVSPQKEIKKKYYSVIPETQEIEKIDLDLTHRPSSLNKWLTK